MIVKNEEAALPRCLESVADWVDEVVVVDTGSSDGTVEVAGAFGARIFHHPWEGDFSKHRNQSISYAGGEWVLIMDADEVLRKGDGPRLREIASCREIDSAMFVVVSSLNRGLSRGLKNQIRLFRRRPDIFYQGIVHNQLQGCKSTRSYPVHIDHYGYDLAPEAQRKKFERTSTLLKRQIRHEPDSYWHRHNLAVCYATHFMFEEAVRAGLDALELARTQGLGGPNLLWTSYVVAASFLKLEEWEKAATQANKTLEMSADHLDSHFLLVLTCHHRKDWSALERHGRAFLRILAKVHSHPERLGFGIIHALNEAWRVWLALGDLELERGERGRAEEAFARALAEAPSPWECEKMTADCYKGRALYEAAARHYALALEEKADRPDVLLGLAFATLQLGDRPGAAAHYQRVLTLQPQTVEALVKLGDIHSAMGKPKPARAFYERALLLEPRLVNVSLRLSRLCLEQGDLEGCVSCCEDILRNLGLPSDKRLDSLKDLAGLFLMIAHEMDRHGKPDLFEEAARMALSLNPQLLRTCQSEGAL